LWRKCELEPSLVVENISKTFKLKRPKQALMQVTNSKSVDTLTALDSISFSVAKGEVFGIIGLNGSGKTTLLRIIAGIYEPDSGKISVEGKIAPLLQIGTGFNLELTAEENIIMAGMLVGKTKGEIKKRVNKIIEFAGLQEFTEMKLKHYSAGMMARLAFATAIQIDPDILLVDEILSVGDIEFTEKSFKEFLSFKKKGKTIIYTTHDLPLLTELCDRVLLLRKGKSVMIGEPTKVIEKYREIST